MKSFLRDAAPDTVPSYRDSPDRKTHNKWLSALIIPLSEGFRAILNFAVEYYDLPKNPCNRVKSIGKKRADEMKFWTLDQFNEVIECEEHPGYHAAFMTLYWTGIREGECLALSPKKVLDSIQSFDITETFKRKDGEDIFDDPKTENSVRVVSIGGRAYFS